MTIDEILTRGVAEVINLDSLKQKLQSGEPLRIKFGVDPTMPDIHLGHAVVMWKLKALQDMGHKILFLIGDYTTKIGDPSGRNTTRPVLSDAEIKENARTYFEQAGKILDVYKAQVWYNSEWFSGMRFNDVLELASKFTVAQIIERDDFTKRLKEGNDIGLHELLYPVMQAYDSVELKADVEFGGSDQKFNMLAGRDLQKKMGLSPQDVVITDLLVGTDGKIKMSKSVGNYIGITEAPNEMFGKVMSIPDELIESYYELCTSIDMPNENPRDQKMRLGFEIVKLYHSENDAQKAQEEFVKVFSNHETPTDIPTINIKDDTVNIVDLIVKANLAPSKSEARRLVEQGAVEVAGERIGQINKEIKIKDGIILRVGKLKFVKILS